MAELWQALIDNSGAVIAVFTVVLAATTIIYVVVTAKLLKQSKNALLADILLRVMETCRREIKETKREEIARAAIFINAWMMGYREIIGEIDKKLGMDVEKLLKVCLSTMFKESAKRVKKLKKEETKNLKRPKDQ